MIMALRYADDTCSNSRAGLQKKMALVKTYCNQVGLRLNVNKLYVFHIQSDGKSRHLPIRSYAEDVHGQ